MSTALRDWVTQKLAPVWLRGTWGGKFLGVVGDTGDRIALAAKDAVKCRLPDQCPNDALPYVGAGYNIERYVADTDGTYRTRISDPWSIWDFGGASTGIITSLHAQGYANVQIKGWYELQPYVPDPWSTWYTAFWVWIDTPHGFVKDGNWNDPGTWGDGGVWDLTCPLSQVLELRNSIRKWKPGHEICAGIVIFFDSDRWDNVTPWDHGNWSDESSNSVVLPG